VHIIFRLSRSRSLPRGPLISVALGLAAALPLLVAGRLPYGHDAAHHLLRLVQFDALLSEGAILPRWAPDLVAGYGYPIFNYYPPLSLLVPTLIHRAGIPYTQSLVAGLALYSILASTGMYAWTRPRLGESAAILAATSYVFCPYLIANVITRTAVPEVMALGLAPWCLYFLERCIEQRNAQTCWPLALLVAAVLLTHNVTAAFLVCALLFYLSVEAFGNIVSGLDVKATLRQLAAPLLALFLGISLAAVYWLPAILELDLVQIDRITLAGWADYRVNFVRLREVFAYVPPVGWLEELVGIAHRTSQNSPSLSPVTAFGAVLGLMGLVLNRKTHHLAKASVVAFTIVAAALFMASPVSSGVWESISPLQTLQFPWRLVGIAAVFLSWLCGLGGLVIERALAGHTSILQRVALPLFTTVVAMYGMSWQYTPRWHDPMHGITVKDVCALEQQFGSLGTTATGEYLPKWVLELPPLDEPCTFGVSERLDTSALPEGSIAQVTMSTSLKTDLSVTVPEDTELVFRIFYYPGWYATVDGRATPVFPSGPQGLLSLDVPSGTHTLEVAFGSTPTRKLALAVSLLSAIALTSYVMCQNRDRFSHPVESSQETGSVSQHASSTTTVLLILVVLAAKLQWADRRFAAYPGLQPPRPASEQFVDEARDDALVLAGVVAPSVAVSGNTIDIYLYWRAGDPLTENYVVSLFVTDSLEQDAGWERVDHLIGYYPTSLWYEGDIHRDHYAIQIPAGTPPGVYEIRALVYPCGSPDNVLSVYSEGSTKEVTVPIGTVSILRPQTPVHPESLDLAGRTTHRISDWLVLLGHGAIPKTARQGDSLSIDLYWYAEDIPTGTTSISLGFADASGTIVWSERIVPVPGFAMENWFAGDVLRGRQLVYVPPTLEGPHSLAVIGDEGPAVVLANVDIEPISRLMAPPDVANATKVQFGRHLSLVGYESESHLFPGEPAHITMVWYVESATRRPLKVFVHIVDSAGTVVAQHDAEPVNWSRPASSWIRGEFLVDQHDLELSAPLAPGSYRVQVGVYDADTGQRLLTDLGNEMLTLEKEIEVSR